jgi:hypothetical protein
MSNFKLIAIVFSFVLPFLLADLLFLFPQTFALTCNACSPQACYCNITECVNGTLDVYAIACTGIPIKEFIFTNGSFTWTSALAQNYYLQAYCDSGIMSNCNNVNLTSYATTTTTTVLQKTDCPYDCCIAETNYVDRYCPEGYDCISNQCISTVTTETQENQGYQINYSIIGIVAIVIIAAVFLFYFFTGKKKPEEDRWSALYKKYRRR